MAGPVSGHGDRIDAILRRALAAWVEAVRRRSGLTLLIAFALSVVALIYTARNLGVISDADRLFDESLRFRQLGLEFDRAFPVLNDNLIVVIDAPSSAEAGEAAEALIARARAEPDSFANAYAPGAGEFFDRNGLLYLELEDLEELADQLATAQPFLAELSRDPSLRGVLELLRRVIEEEHGSTEIDLSRVLGQIALAVGAAAEARARPFAFEEFVLGEEPEGGDGRRYVFIQPEVDFGDFVPARAGIDRLRALVRELENERVAGAGDGSLRVRITGNLALASEELDVVRRQAALAGLASFTMVAAILLFAFRSPRLVLAILLTLAIGLAWTAAFAALAIGHLNVVSVAFAVLFIGLGVDFGIHFCLRYQEARARG
ncbi:MMPL family transporter, partial [bacterium]|nr:MMPL family transporter [bacterium]